jgi:hypothetical protein
MVQFVLKIGELKSPHDPWLDDELAEVPPGEIPGGPAPGTEFSNGGLIPYAGGIAFHNDDGSLRGATAEQDGLLPNFGLPA